MTTIVRVGPTMFDAIYGRLLRRHDARIAREQWRRIFDYEWRSDEDHLGYCLLEQGVPVAFLGLIFSRVVVDGVEEKLCNTTSWVAEEAHRSAASLLVLQLRYLHDYTITNLSSNLRAFEVFRALGFEKLDSERRLILAAPFVRAAANPAGSVLANPAEIEASLQEPELRIFRDHRRYAQHLLVRDEHGACYVVYTMRRELGLRRARIHYVGDPACFVRNVGNVTAALCRNERVWLCEADRRLLPDPWVPRSFLQSLPVPRLYRSRRLRPEQISNLYSELVLLGF